MVVEVAAVRMDIWFWPERFVGAVVKLHTSKKYLDGLAGFLPARSASLLELRFGGEMQRIYMVGYF
jgi:hypothetical protein